MMRPLTAYGICHIVEATKRVQMPTKSFDEYMGRRSLERSPDEAQVFTALAQHYDGVSASVGQQLAAIREAAGLTQAELAARCGVTQGDISRIERDQANPTAKTLQRIGDVLGVELAWVPRSHART